MCRAAGSSCEVARERPARMDNKRALCGGQGGGARFWPRERRLMRAVYRPQDNARERFHEITMHFSREAARGLEQWIKLVR